MQKSIGLIEKEEGVSIYNKEILDILEKGFKPEIIQLPLNILDSNLYRDGVVKKLAKNSIEIQVGSVFLQGLFYTDSELKKILKMLFLI